MEENPLFDRLHQWYLQACLIKKQQKKAIEAYNKNRKRKHRRDEDVVLAGWNMTYQDVLKFLGATFLDYIEWFSLEAKEKKTGRNEKDAACLRKSKRLSKKKIRKRPTKTIRHVKKDGGGYQAHP